MILQNDDDMEPEEQPPPFPEYSIAVQWVRFSDETVDEAAESVRKCISGIASHSKSKFPTSSIFRKRLFAQRFHTYKVTEHGFSSTFFHF